MVNRSHYIIFLLYCQTLRLHILFLFLHLCVSYLWIYITILFYFCQCILIKSYIKIRTSFNLYTVYHKNRSSTQKTTVFTDYFHTFKNIFFTIKLYFVVNLFLLDTQPCHWTDPALVAWTSASSNGTVFIDIMFIAECSDIFATGFPGIKLVLPLSMERIFLIFKVFCLLYLQWNRLK